VWRLGEEWDLTEALRRLASSRVAVITGAALAADGGESLWQH